MPRAPVRQRRVSGLRDALRPTWWAIRRLARPRGTAITLNDCCRMRIDPAVNLPVRNARYELQFFRAFLSSITPADIVFDIGANQGIYMTAAALKATEGRVFAFEPAPAALDVLKRQVRINDIGDRVRIVPSPVGNRHGCTMEFHVAPTAVGWASAVYKGPGSKAIMVREITLDAFCSENDVAPDIMKIDVEGFEWEVLRGAEGILRRRMPKVFCALHPELLASRGQTGDQVVTWMKSIGYRALWRRSDRNEILFLRS